MRWIIIVGLILLAGRTVSGQDAPTPLPVAPEVALLSAERQLLNGYYEAAVLTYQAILAQGETVPLEQRAAAVYGLGHAALREGLFAEAATALDVFIASFPSDPRIARAHFLRGDARLGLNDWAGALADFETYLALRPGLIDSYAWERIADAQTALGRIDQALDSYKNAADAARSLVPLLALRERLAQVYASQGRFVEAVNQYDQILAVAQNAPYRAGIEWLAAQAEINAGQVEAGLARLERIFTTYPTRPEAYSAMERLLQEGRTLDPLQIGRVRFAYGDYEGTVTALIAFTTSRALGEIPAETHMLLGRAYRELGNTQAALTAFATVIGQYPTDPLFGEALLEQGRTRFLANDIDGAIAHYLFIADTYGYLDQAPEALWRAGFLYSTTGRQAEARAVFDRLATAYPDAPQVIDGLQIAAAGAFAQGDGFTAQRYYNEIAVKATGEDRAQAFLQVGRLALQRGDNATATGALQQAAAAAPDSYFATRARDIITGVAPFSRPTREVFYQDEAAEIAAAEDWLRATFSIDQPGPLWPLNPTLAADPRLIRGSELWAVAAYDEARVEFADLVTASETDPLASYQLAIYLRGIGAYHNSIFAAANVIRAAGIGTLDAPRFIARMRYPVYYLDVVLDSAQRYDLDPLLLFALIRHESLFDTYATAAAGEKGLTQVIPSTAEYIAQQIAFPDYQHSDLFRPYVGVEFGAFFLDENLERFDGNVTAALAGYNAGPGRAAQWLEISGGDHDAFLSAITIDSTRIYVQRIYSFFSIYRALYGSD